MYYMYDVHTEKWNRATQLVNFYVFMLTKCIFTTCINKSHIIQFNIKLCVV